MSRYHPAASLLLKWKLFLNGRVLRGRSEVGEHRCRKAPREIDPIVVQDHKDERSKGRMMLKTNEMMGRLRGATTGLGSWTGCGAGGIAGAGRCTGGTFEEAAGDAGETEQGAGEPGPRRQRRDDGVDWASLIDIPGMDFVLRPRQGRFLTMRPAATKIALAGRARRCLVKALRWKAHGDYYRGGHLRGERRS